MATPKSLFVAAAGVAGILAWFRRSYRNWCAEQESDLLSVMEKERRFRRLLEAAPDAMVVSNRQGEVVLLNAQAERLFGYSAEELVGRNVVILMPERFRAAHANQCSKYFHSPQAKSNSPGLELCGLRKDGTEVPVEVSLSPFVTKEGRLLIAAIHDITERKRVESVLEHERHLLNTLMDRVPDRIYFKDRESRFMRNNPAHAARFGFADPAELIGKTDFDFFPPEHAEQTRSDELEIMATGKVLDSEEKIVWPDGRMEWARITRMPLRDVNGQIIGTFGISRDITDRKRAEHELRSISNRLVLATQAASLGIWDLDPVNNRLIWDEEMYRIFRITRDQFSGTYGAWEATVHPEDLAREDAKIQDVFRGMGNYDSEFRIVWPDKTIRYVKANAVVVRDASGRPLRMIGTNRDVTDQRRAEDELRKTVDELARSNSELERFAYVASHDLQEPLRAVTGCLQLLQKTYGEKLGADADELIRHAVEGAARMRTLIGDLLAFSRVGTGGKPFEPTDCDDALDLAIANLEVTLRENRAIITRDPLPNISADPTQLPQLFQNLIGNAVKFHSEEQPRIHIGAEWQDGDWLFSVRDNGIGIEAQYRERIFVIFQRLHTRAEYSGTGVGLAICRRIVERHGGQIWVESEPGKGTTFFFTLPEKENETP